MFDIYSLFTSEAFIFLGPDTHWTPRQWFWYQSCLIP